MIDTKRDRENLFTNLAKRDWITKLMPLIEPGGMYKLRLEDGRFTRKLPSIAWNVPWVYVQTMNESRCDIYHQVFFNTLKHIHSYCRGCWKVVVRPQTLVELFDLYEIQRSMDVPCKCGIELRDTVHGLYGGYFYNRGKEQGLERYKEVRGLVDEKLSDNTPVILKRYCTEFEIGKGSQGPSDKIEDITKEENQMEIEVESMFPREDFGATIEPDYLIARVMKEWMMHAYRNGDETYKKFTNGEPLFPAYITYHEEEKENGW